MSVIESWVNHIFSYVISVTQTCFQMSVVWVRMSFTISLAALRVTRIKLLRKILHSFKFLLDPSILLEHWSKDSNSQWMDFNLFLCFRSRNLTHCKKCKYDKYYQSLLGKICAGIFFRQVLFLVVFLSDKRHNMLQKHFRIKQIILHSFQLQDFLSWMQTKYE